MKISTKAKIASFALIIVAQGFISMSMAQQIPIDPGIKMGKLDNGLTYYIRHNEEPKERASFYIIQNVGALLENDEQNGLAHFLEHMAFNGTEHFPGKGILNTLEKHGVAFGRNINAYTSFNETVYNLSDIPVNDPGLIDTCLLVLNDWSNYLLLTEEEIEAERGVISEEWRTRRNANFRMRAEYFPTLLGDSKFAERDVIGDLDIIKNFDYETLRNFYHDWYRTDLQAIAIVGDIDVDEVEVKIKNLFGKIPAVEDPQHRPFFDIPEHKETRFVVATDPEASQNMINIFIKHQATPADKKDAVYLRNQYIANLFNSMTGARINELLQKGEPPFIMGSISYGSFLRGYDVLSIGAVSSPEDETKALKAIYTETERIVRHGFMPGEFQRAKSNLLTSMKSAYDQRDKIHNNKYIRGIQAHFLSGEPLTSPETDWQIGQLLLESISVEDVNAAKDKWISDNNRVIIVMGPKDAEHLDEEESLLILKEIKETEIEPYEDVEIVTKLISDKLAGSKIVTSSLLDKFGAVEWKLSNNATVIYKHADFEKDNVAITGFSKGGMSAISTGQLETIMMLPQFMGLFGTGDFDAIALRNALTGKKVSVQSNIRELTETISGSSTPKDFETMMQLVYLNFERPRFDKQSYDALLSRFKAFLPNMENDPNKIMSDSLQMIFTNFHPRTKLLNTKFLEQLKFEDMEKLYKDRIKDAGDFIFIIVGNIDEETVKQNVEYYIGSLTDDPRTESWTDHNVKQPEGRVEKKIEIPLETAKANVNILIRNDFKYTAETNLYLNMLKSILTLRYTEEVREKEGGTYGVSVSASNKHFPSEEKTLQMKFDTDPEKADYLKSIIFREIEKIAKNGPTEEDLDKVVKNIKKDREQSKEHNSYWMNTIYNYYYHGIDGNAPENFDEIIDRVTVTDIQKFTSNFMNDPDIADVVFVPKK